MYLKVPYKFYYDKKQFPFREIILNILEVNSLEDLHIYENYELLSREKDQKTTWHRKYYSKFFSHFQETYLNFLDYIKESFDYKEIIYQKIPSFRVHLANGNVAVGEWHKDKTYNHGPNEINFWLPFTNTNEENTIWMESKEDKGDYRACKVEYGEVLVFNGANLYHGNKKNKTNDTRVSIDFRLVDPNKFIPNELGSINMNSKFKIGDYFEKK